MYGSRDPECDEGISRKMIETPGVKNYDRNLCSFEIQNIQKNTYTSSKSRALFTTKSGLSELPFYWNDEQFHVSKCLALCVSQTSLKVEGSKTNKTPETQGLKSNKTA